MTHKKLILNLDLDEREELFYQLDKQFTKYYRMRSEDMNLGEKLFFEHLREHVIRGLDYDLWGEDE